MKRSKKVISLLFTLLMLGSVAIVAPVAAAEEEAPQWVEKAPMKIGRTYFSAEAVDGKIYVFGGMGFIADVEIYDPTTNQWTTGASMPTPRHSIATAVLNGKIYVIAGTSAKGDTGLVEIYDPKTDSWETGTPLPIAKRELSAVSLNGKIYALGGRTGSDNRLDTMDIYDPETNVWTNGPLLPIKATFSKSVAVQDKIYVFGGAVIIEGTNTGSDKVLIFDAKANAWEEGRAMPKAVSAPSVNLVNNEIYVLGGRNYHIDNNSVYIFDIAKKQWSDGPNMLIDRSLHASVVIDNTLYVIGGDPDGTENYKKMESLYIPTSKEEPKLAVLLNPGEVVQLSVSDNLSDNLSDNAGLTWTSSGAGVATVNTNGKVTAIGPGLCEITAKNADGTFDQSIPVRVLPGTADLFRLAVHLTPRQTKRLSMLNDQEGVTWKSLDEAVVTVDPNGQITAAGAGLAIVEATKGDITQQMYVRVKATALAAAG